MDPVENSGDALLPFERGILFEPVMVLEKRMLKDA